MLPVYILLIRRSAGAASFNTQHFLRGILRPSLVYANLLLLMLLLLAISTGSAQSASCSTPSFTLQGSYPSQGYQPYSLATYDLNGDGLSDVVVANGSTKNIAVLLNNGNGTLDAPALYSIEGKALSVAVADLNGDGKGDIAVSYVPVSGRTKNVAIFLNNGAGSFLAAGTYFDGIIGGSFYIAATDLNGDNKPDLALANPGSSDMIGVLLNNGAGTFADAMVYPSGGSGSFSLTVADFNGDQAPDLAIANFLSGTVTTLLNTGVGVFIPAGSITTGGSQPVSITSGDFNADGKADVAAVNRNSDNISVLSGNGDGTFGPAALYSSGGTYPYSITIGDYNGDGKADLAVSNFSTNNVGLLLGKGNGTFQAAVTFAVGGGPVYIATGKLNGGGKFDLATINYNSTVSVLLNACDVDTDGDGIPDAEDCDPLQFTTAAIQCPVGPGVKTDPNSCTGHFSLQFNITGFVNPTVTARGLSGAGTFTITPGATTGCSTTYTIDAEDLPIGLNNIQLFASDDYHKVNCVFGSYVTDYNPPVVTCPANITVAATDGSGAVVNYPAATAANLCPGTYKGAPAVSYSIPSGTKFPIGKTTIKVVATDQMNLKDSCIFSVTVNCPAATAKNPDTDNDGLPDACDKDDDNDGDPDSTDCAPLNAAIHHGAREVCNGKDDDCDGQVDEGFTKKSYYKDEDCDGYGDPKKCITTCDKCPKGYVANNKDCNDHDKTIHPGAPELCDNKDNDCDGKVDEGFTKKSYYLDYDKDGYGDPKQCMVTCKPCPSGYVTNKKDCNDHNKNVHPGAKEIAGNKIDDNCNCKVDERTSMARESNDEPISDEPENLLGVERMLKVNVLPNPSPNYFTLTIKGGSDTPVELRVVDITGRLIEVKDNVPARSTLTIGHRYTPGIYFLEVRQGIERVVTRCIRQ